MQSCSNHQRMKLAPGVYFTHVDDGKFCSNRLSVNWITRLAPDTVTENAVVPFILRLGCRTCPDFSTLNKRLGLLYGAQLSGDVSRFGREQLLCVSVRGLDDRLALEGENMVRLLSELLCDVTLDPCLENGAFPERSAALERENLIDTIEAEINDKRLYAQSQCMSLMFGDGPEAIRPYGTVERARELTPASAYAAYQRLLRDSRVEIVFVGAGDYHTALETFRKRFGEIGKTEPSAYEDQETIRDGAVKTRTETMDVAQSKLVLGFRYHAESEHEDRAVRAMSALYGGTPFSKLFLNVREKLSLCYYCSSRVYRGSRALLVSSGVEKENRAAAEKEILSQLEAMRRGEFTDEEFRNTILTMNTGLAATGDSLGALENWYLTQILLGTDESPEQEREAVAALTREDLIRAANNVQLDAVYFLTSPDGQGKEQR